MTIQTVMADMLKKAGFDAMAAGVQNEHDRERLGRYARVIYKHNHAINEALANKLRATFAKAGIAFTL